MLDSKFAILKGNIDLWEKVMKYLSSTFYKPKIFLYKKKINERSSSGVHSL